ncbi:MAG: 4Fe-4S dicluster domain-containing protein [Candidatus Lokiarchaeota archaeon]|nr:4Fe-4S dicluster domain-containing protein [Candidatus Lokiarchaeota archaeon]MBD3201565.1 4Fe-4S dicluster domain-containing protein [Candidatus Lokiarchaeota archaeon]
MTDKNWYKAARTIVKAGNLPFPINDTLMELLHLLLNEREVEFISSVFRKPNMNMKEIKTRIDWKEDEILTILDRLMDEGVITGTESKTTGITVYRLMPPFPGLFEFTLMRGKSSKKEKKLAKLFEQLFNELSELTQKNYDNIVSQYRNFPPIDRVIPVEEEIEEVPVENVLPFEEVSKIVHRFDDIALVHCYCRHEKDLLNQSCKVTDERENCLLFGKTAKFAIEHDFGRPISKGEVSEILRTAEREGLVHKAFHIHLDVEREEEAICNCCKCCCGIFTLYNKGIMPYNCYTSYIAKVNEADCTSCGTCIEKCPMETISLIDTIAYVGEEKCIGCGVCAYNCPSDAIVLERTGMRQVFVPPPKL